MESDNDEGLVALVFLRMTVMVEDLEEERERGAMDFSEKEGMILFRFFKETV